MSTTTAPEIVLLLPLLLLLLSLFLRPGKAKTGATPPDVGVMPTLWFCFCSSRDRSDLVEGEEIEEFNFEHPMMVLMTDCKKK